MNYGKGFSLLAGACVGAGIMYLLDPQMGKRRLSLIRDQFTKVNHEFGRFVEHRSEDVKNRAYGLYCEAKSLVGSPCESDRTRLRRVG